jgi:Host cell surface-exposed lipoprotein
MDTSSFSAEGLRQQLEFEGFTAGQANYALDAVGY